MIDIMFCLYIVYSSNACGSWECLHCLSVSVASQNECFYIFRNTNTNTTTYIKKQIQKRTHARVRNIYTVCLSQLHHTENVKINISYILTNTNTNLDTSTNTNTNINTKNTITNTNTNTNSYIKTNTCGSRGCLSCITRETSK